MRNRRFPLGPGLAVAVLVLAALVIGPWVRDSLGFGPDVEVEVVRAEKRGEEFTLTYEVRNDGRGGWRETATVLIPRSGTTRRERARLRRLDADSVIEVTETFRGLPEDATVEDYQYWVNVRRRWVPFGW